VLVVYNYNPSCLGGTDQEDYGLRPAKEEKKKQDHYISEISNTEEGWRSRSSGRIPSKHEALSSNPSTTKKVISCQITKQLKIPYCNNDFFS
jgi:hypothetical protein